MASFDVDKVYPADLSVMDVWGFVQKVKDYSNIDDKLEFGLECSWMVGRAVNTVRNGGGLPFFGSNLPANAQPDVTVEQLCAEAEREMNAEGGSPVGNTAGISPTLLILIIQIVSKLFGGDSKLLDLILDLIRNN